MSPLKVIKRRCCVSVNVSVCKIIVILYGVVRAVVFMFSIMDLYRSSIIRDCKHLQAHTHTQVQRNIHILCDNVPPQCHYLCSA